MRRSLERVKRHTRIDPNDDLISIMQDRLLDPIAAKRQILLKVTPKNDCVRQLKRFASSDSHTAIANDIGNIINSNLEKRMPPPEH